MFSDHHPRTLLMAAKASSGDWSTEMVAVKFGSKLFMAVPSLCEHVGLTFSCADQLAQIAVDEHAPGVGAATVALNLRFEARVGKADFRLAIFPGDVKNDVRAGPFALVFHKAQMAVGHVPGNLFAGNKFRDLLRGAVRIFVTIRELNS